MPLLSQSAVYALLGIFFCLFAYCAYQRVTYPFEIDWLEGELICHAVKLIKGHAIYAPPSTEFVAELYPPFYYAVSALFFKIFATFNFLIPRLLSVFCLMGILCLLYLIQLKEGGNKSTAVISSGFFLSFYEIHGPWYDVGRVDMLFFLLVLSGLYATAYSKNTWRGVCAGSVLLVLACYTKQPALAFIPFAALYLYLSDKKSGIVFALLSLGLAAGIFYILNLATDGWFATYTWVNPLRYNVIMNKPLSELPFQLMFELRDRLLPEMRYEIFYKLPVFFTLALAFAVNRALALKRTSKLRIWEITSIPAAVSYFSIRPHLGSEKNDFIFMTLWGCMLLGFLLARLARPGFDSGKRTTVYLLLALQLSLCLYNPKNVVPSPGSAARGAEFIAMVKSIPGPVYIPFHSFYGYMAGKGMFLNGGAYWAYQVLSRDKFRMDDMIQKLKNKYFDAIIIDEKAYVTMKGEKIAIDNVKLLLTSRDEMSQAVDENYAPAKRVPFRNDEEFRNVTGFTTRPELILEPKK